MSLIFAPYLILFERMFYNQNVLKFSKSNSKLYRSGESVFRENGRGKSWS